MFLNTFRHKTMNPSCVHFFFTFSFDTKVACMKEKKGNIALHVECVFKSLASGLFLMTLPLHNLNTISSQASKQI